MIYIHHIILDGTNWQTLTDPQGNVISKTSASIEAITEATRFVRPRVSAGDGTTSLAVVMSAYNETPGGGR